MLHTFTHFTSIQPNPDVNHGKTRQPRRRRKKGYHAISRNTIRSNIASRLCTFFISQQPLTYPPPKLAHHNIPSRPHSQNVKASKTIYSNSTQDPSAALRLVSVRPLKPSAPSDQTAPTGTADTDADPDLQRAKDLVELHYAVREAHKRGELGQGLEEARAAVRRAVEG